MSQERTRLAQGIALTAFLAIAGGLAGVLYGMVIVPQEGGLARPFVILMLAVPPTVVGLVVGGFLAVLLPPNRVTQAARAAAAAAGVAAVLVVAFLAMGSVGLAELNALPERLLYADAGRSGGAA